ncbi:ABC transporter permease/substrate-binding protein [Fibrella sp. HMF5335]|uniref:ABC transporter permease/substrate-binding protein n=1 Tax=Fibrella rubiginis TaxID=2817060 RepID=A0A939GE86_9BACT|nr:ABC transporter permease/substrate-binding protein [Fibrella rubiginis]MBO0937354.1 ABC transporter permease/substrate-binding protein [Fibrella rubiginis]
MIPVFTFLRENAAKLADQTLTHLGLTFASLLMALLLGLPLGIYIARRKRVASAVLGVAGVLQTVPSIALLGFLIPLLGIGAGPALTALFLYALLPIIRNTYVGISEVNPTLTEAARGMGMTARQVLWRVELPLAMPVIFAGIRTATVINVGVATLAAYVAAGGLGEFIFGGIALNNTNMMLAGAIPAALLAVGFDLGLARLQRVRWSGSVGGDAGGASGKKRVATGAGLLVVVAVMAVAWPRNNPHRLLAGFAHEFGGRADGYPGLQKVYGMTIENRLLDQSLMYEAIRTNKVDVISGYSTDGRIKAFGLTVLDDDKHAFPPYAAAPVVREATLAKYPELQPALDRLNGRLTDSIMTELNYRADYLHESPERVARGFLMKVGLLQPAIAARTGQVVMGSKVFTEQYILAEIYRQLIEGYTTLRVVSKTGFGGTQLCFDALRTGAIDFYPEYTGTGLLVILQPAQATLDSLKRLPGAKQPAAIYSYVKAEFTRRYALRWGVPLGFNNAYCLMMRQTDAKQRGIRTLSELTRYVKGV